MPRLSATAVSIDATISFPIKAGQTTSVFYTNAYATGAATVGAGAAGTTAGGGVATTSSSGTAKATSGVSGARREVVGAGAIFALVATVTGLLAGAALL